MDGRPLQIEIIAAVLLMQMAYRDFPKDTKVELVKWTKSFWRKTTISYRASC